MKSSFTVIVSPYKWSGRNFAAPPIMAGPVNCHNIQLFSTSYLTTQLKLEKLLCFIDYISLCLCKRNMNTYIFYVSDVLHVFFYIKNTLNKSVIVFQFQLEIKSAYVFIQFEKPLSRSCKTKKNCYFFREPWDCTLRRPVVKKGHPWDCGGQHHWLPKATTRR